MVSMLALVSVSAGLIGSTAASAAPATPQQSVNLGVSYAASQGITQYISVRDRFTGEVVAESDNANAQVASESVMKLFIATYYAVKAGGAGSLILPLLSRLETMIIYSDDAIASGLFRSDIVSFVASRYGLPNTTDATPNAFYWGRTRITAHDMATFMWQMSNDPLVGYWLVQIMARTADFGSDGYNQNFGFNNVLGESGSKQGWGNDNWTANTSAVHSVGFTDRWFAAVLQTGPPIGYYPMRDTASFTAQRIQEAHPVPVAPPAPDAQSGYITVKGGQLEPLANSWVTIMSADCTRQYSRMRTDDTGRIPVTAYPGVYCLNLTDVPGGYVPAGISWWAFQPNEGINVTLKAAYSPVHGTFTLQGSADGRGVPGATVRFYQADCATATSVGVTDANGVIPMTAHPTVYCSQVISAPSGYTPDLSLVRFSAYPIIEFGAVRALAQNPQSADIRFVDGATGLLVPGVAIHTGPADCSQTFANLSSGSTGVVTISGYPQLYCITTDAVPPGYQVPVPQLLTIVAGQPSSLDIVLTT